MAKLFATGGASGPVPRKPAKQTPAPAKKKPSK